MKALNKTDYRRMRELEDKTGNLNSEEFSEYMHLSLHQARAVMPGITRGIIAILALATIATTISTIFL